jgi:polysaccharide biosynthesis transport protein
MNTPVSPPALMDPRITELDQARQQLVGTAIGKPRTSPLRSYWDVLRKRRWVIAAVLIAGLAAAFALTMTAQRKYVATVSLEIDRETDKSAEIGQDKVRETLNPEFYQTQYALLRSRALAESVVHHLDLDQDDQFLGGYRGHKVPADHESRVRTASGILMGSVEVVPVRLSSVVQLQVTSPSPAAAARIANAYATDFIRTNLDRRFQATAFAREFLEKRIDQVREHLEKSERDEVAYATQNGIINIAPVDSDPTHPTAEQSLAAASLARANDALANARTARIEAQNRYRQSGGGNEVSLTNQALNAALEQRAALRAQQQKLTSDYGPEHPQVKATQAQLAELDAEIAQQKSQISGTLVSASAAQYRQAAASEAQQASRVAGLTQQLNALRQRGIQYNILQRDVDTNRALYNALLQRFKEVSVEGGVGANNVSIVDRADVPLLPSSPSLRLNLFLGLLLGLVGGIVLALVLEQLDESTLAPSDVGEKLGIPLLGTIPRLRKGETVEEQLAQRWSPLSEAYLSVLTALHFSTRNGTPRSLLLTSSQAGEGKSLTARALAESLARLGHKVLLIDADLRKPSLHSIPLAGETEHLAPNSVRKAGGLSNLLVGEGRLEDFIDRTSVEGLDILQAGPIAPNAAELLAGPRLKNLISVALKLYDHVVIDGPPLLGLADAPLLAGVVEAVVFLLEWGRTNTSQARSTVDRLRDMNAPLVGAILTKFDTRKSGYGYGDKYSYAYGSR